jgi:DNA-binding PadR family transcriptional regulator
MKRRPRRTETPITTHVAVLQGLRWGRFSATDVIAEIDTRTRGRVRIHIGLVYKTLGQLTDRGMVRRVVSPYGGAGIYELTALGRRHATREGAALARLFA